MCVCACVRACYSAENQFIFTEKEPLGRTRGRRQASTAATPLSSPANNNTPSQKSNAPSEKPCTLCLQPRLGARPIKVLLRVDLIKSLLGEDYSTNGDGKFVCKACDSR